MHPNSPFLPQTLEALGFVSKVIGDVVVIVPPVCSIPGGSFLMGSDESRDEFAQVDEGPQHSVTVASFHIGKYPVTVAEYACAVRAKAIPPPETSSDLFEEELWQNQLQHLDHPVQRIGEGNAIAYAQWLSHMTAIPWRLPTEAEWEKAARGTDGRIYPWGDTEDTARANVGSMGVSMFDGPQTPIGPGTTTRVGSYPLGESPYEVQDMAGNVWEWCGSLLHPYPYRADDGREDATIRGHRVLRGGSYFENIWFARAAYRGRISAPASIYGFRLAYSS